MRQIVYLLSGNSAQPPILDRQIDRFVERMRDEVEDIIWTASFNQSPHVANLFEAYQNLDSTQRARFFLSPDGYEAVYSATRSASEENILALTRGLSELSKSGHSEDAASWPADQTIPKGPTPTSLVLGDTIAVDLGSSNCRRVDITSPVFAGEFVELDIQEANIVREKLYNALNEIDATAPTLSRLIRNYTRVIYVRKAEGQLPSSEQVDSELGAIRLLNVQSDSYGQDQVVDDIIHESIHNLLGTFEYLNFPFIPAGYRPSAGLRPVSPWSMRAIQLLPFLHAAFVYFGMLHYAELALKRDDISSERRKSLLQRRNRYASGFLMPGQLSDFASAIGRADPRVLLALDWMQRVVRSNCGRTELSDQLHQKVLPSTSEGELVAELIAA